MRITPTWQVLDLGLMPYAQVHALQKELALEAQNQNLEQGLKNTLLVVEHPPVITTGRHGGAENLLISEAVLNERGVELVRTERGGNITCHFPGQLVAYPIVRLLPKNTAQEPGNGPRQPSGVKDFFSDLEQIIIRVIAAYGLHGEQIEGRSGVWIADRKICAMGIAVKHWVTYHGLALNVTNDLSLFNLVTPCGLPDATVTSLHRELGREDISLAEVKAAFLQTFKDYYQIPAWEIITRPAHV